MSTFTDTVREIQKVLNHIPGTFDTKRLAWQVTESEYQEIQREVEKIALYSDAPVIVTGLYLLGVRLFASYDDPIGIRLPTNDKS